MIVYDYAWIVSQTGNAVVYCSLKNFSTKNSTISTLFKILAKTIWEVFYNLYCVKLNTGNSFFRNALFIANIF